MKHFCHHCGKEVENGNKFCPSCGALQDRYSEDDYYGEREADMEKPKTVKPEVSSEAQTGLDLAIKSSWFFQPSPLASRSSLSSGWSQWRCTPSNRLRRMSHTASDSQSAPLSSSTPSLVFWWSLETPTKPINNPLKSWQFLKYPLQKRGIFFFALISKESHLRILLGIYPRKN